MQQVNVMQSKVPRPIQSLPAQKVKPPTAVRQTITQNTVLNRQTKLSLCKINKKNDIKPKLIKVYI